MGIYRIKNKYIYRKSKKDKHKYNEDGYHDYIGIHSDRDNTYNLIGLTHVLDPKRQKQIMRKNIKIMTFKAYRTQNGVDIPSGVNKRIITSDVNGDPMDLDRVKAESVKNGKLTKTQAHAVAKFVKLK